MYVNIYIYIYIYIHTHIFICIYIHIFTGGERSNSCHTHTHTRTHTHTNTHSCTHTHTLIYIYIHTRTHMQEGGVPIHAIPVLFNVVDAGMCKTIRFSTWHMSFMFFSFFFSPCSICWMLSTLVRVKWFISECANGSFIFVNWPVQICGKTRVASINYMCAMVHVFVWHDSFICVMWLTDVCDWNLFTCKGTYMIDWVGRLWFLESNNALIPFVTDWGLWCLWEGVCDVCEKGQTSVSDGSVSLTCMTWLIYVCDMTHS